MRLKFYLSISIGCFISMGTNLHYSHAAQNDKDKPLLENFQKQKMTSTPQSGRMPPLSFTGRATAVMAHLKGKGVTTTDAREEQRAPLSAIPRAIEEDQEEYNKIYSVEIDPRKLRDLIVSGEPDETDIKDSAVTEVGTFSSPPLSSHNSPPPSPREKEPQGEKKKREKKKPFSPPSRSKSDVKDTSKDDTVEGVQVEEAEDPSSKNYRTLRKDSAQDFQEELRFLNEEVRKQREKAAEARMLEEDGGSGVRVEEAANPDDKYQTLRKSDVKDFQEDLRFLKKEKERKQREKAAEARMLEEDSGSEEED